MYWSSFCHLLCCIPLSLHVCLQSSLSLKKGPANLGSHLTSLFKFHKCCFHSREERCLHVLIHKWLHSRQENNLVYILIRGGFSQYLPALLGNYWAQLSFGTTSDSVLRPYVYHPALSLAYSCDPSTYWKGIPALDAQALLKYCSLFMECQSI